MYSLGDVADDILATFNLFDKEQCNLYAVKASFDNYFTARKCFIFDHAIFNKQVQKSEGSADSHYINLRLSGDQLDSELTLHNTISVVRQSKNVKTATTVNTPNFRNKSNVSVDEVRHKHDLKFSNHHKPK